jgi:hypothetical protein
VRRSFHIVRLPVSIVKCKDGLRRILPGVRKGRIGSVNKVLDGHVVLDLECLDQHDQAAANVRAAGLLHDLWRTAGLQPTALPDSADQYTHSAVRPTGGGYLGLSAGA